MRASTAGLQGFDIQEHEIVDLSKPADYTALSYVWSSARSENVHGQVHQENNHATLQATVADAIGVTDAIGLRYIWVDYLCIDQSQPDEVTSTIANMGRIYKHAYSTIIDASGGDCGAGLARVGRPCRNTEQQIIINLPSQGRTALAVSPPHLPDLWNKSPWAH